MLVRREPGEEGSGALPGGGVAARTPAVSGGSNSSGPYQRTWAQLPGYLAGGLLCLQGTLSRRDGGDDLGILESAGVLDAANDWCRTTRHYQFCHARLEYTQISSPR